MVHHGSQSKANAETILPGRTGVSRTMVFFTDLLVFFIFQVFPRDCFCDSLSLFRASRWVAAILSLAVVTSVL